MNTPTILVTGATGNVGRPLVAGLLADGARARALTRDPAAASFPPGVAVAGGDYAAPGRLAGARRAADGRGGGAGAAGLRADRPDLRADRRGVAHPDPAGRGDRAGHRPAGALRGTLTRAVPAVRHPAFPGARSRGSAEGAGKLRR